MAAGHCDNNERKAVLFYLGQATDVAGRTIDDILSWNDLRLEGSHDYIQWLFPLQNRSAYNAFAPIISTEEIETFRNSNNLKAKLKESFVRLLNFYGFELQEAGSGPVVEYSNDFKSKSENWLTLYNHNHLRITRILKSLSILGLKKYADAFMKRLEDVYSKHPQMIGAEALNYWREAVS
ncbi:MAG: opioid growth factor receptor-related protein [Patescibacteria group bacterium]